MIYDLWEAATGQRLINNNFFRIGGVACDLPYGWLEKCIDFCDWFGPKIDEYEKLITNNPIFKKRIEGLGTIQDIRQSIGLCLGQCLELLEFLGI